MEILEAIRKVGPTLGASRALSRSNRPHRIPMQFCTQKKSVSEQSQRFGGSQKLVLQMVRFSHHLLSLRNIHVKCYDWRNSFNGNYFDLMDKVLQRKRNEGKFRFRATNQPRRKKSECLLNATPAVQKQVRDYLIEHYDYYRFCDHCLGSEDDLFTHGRGVLGV